MVGKMRLAMMEVLRCLRLKGAICRGHLLMEKSIGFHRRGACGIDSKLPRPCSFD